MVRTNISNLKNRLSHYLPLVRAGEVVQITGVLSALKVEREKGRPAAGYVPGWKVV